MLLGPIGVERHQPPEDFVVAQVSRKGPLGPQTPERTRSTFFAQHPGHSYNQPLMSQLTIEQLTQDALTLPENERAQLVQTLLQSLEPPIEEGVDAAWDAEVSRRVESVHQGTAHGRPAEDVFRDIRARHQQ